MTAVIPTLAALETVLLDYLALKQHGTGPRLQIAGEVVTAWLKVRSEEEVRNAQHGNLFNPLAFVPLKETIHSRIIGDLLNPRGSHGQRSLFLNCFLARLGIPEPNVGVWQHTVEADRVDVMLSRVKPQSVILVENKANDAEDQPNQLYRYWHRQVWRRFPKLDYAEPQTLRSFRVIYLSSDGKKMPEPHSVSRPEGWDGPGTLPLPCEPFSLGELLPLLKAEALKTTPETNRRLRTFLEMYSELWKP